jgi:hypothetical protein
MVASVHAPAHLPGKGGERLPIDLPGHDIEQADDRRNIRKHVTAAKHRGTIDSAGLWFSATP